MFKIEKVYNGHEVRAVLFVKQRLYGQELWVPVHDVPAGDPCDPIAARKQLRQEMNEAVAKAPWAL